MKKRVVSLLLAAALMIGALAGCGSDSKDGESESVTESARNESVTSVPSKEQDSGRPDDSTSSAPSDASGKGRDRRDTRSHESRVDSNESRGKDVTETPEAPEDAAGIARAALDGQIKLKNTVEYSYMNNITCSVEGTEVLIETANKVKAYGTEDVQGNILTVSKESELSRDGQILNQGKFWYDQDGNVYISEYVEETGTFSDWRDVNYGPGMTWMNETGLEVYQEIVDGNIQPAVLESEDRTKYILYFALNGEQTKSLFGRLFDDVSVNSIPISLSEAETVEVQAAVNKTSYQPSALSIKVAGFESGLAHITDYEISLAYTTWSTSSVPLEIPQDVIPPVSITE